MAKNIPTENLIRHWEAKLQYDKYLMDPSVRIIVQGTLEDLKELEKIKSQEQRHDKTPPT